MHLIEALAVVGEDAAAHFVAEAEPELPEPVWICEALAGRGDDVRRPVSTPLSINCSLSVRMNVSCPSLWQSA